jgi:hypothetical protein
MYVGMHAGGRYRVRACSGPDPRQPVSCVNRGIGPLSCNSTLGPMLSRSFRETAMEQCVCWGVEYASFRQAYVTDDSIAASDKPGL